jgi:hypothetical protein
MRHAQGDQHRIEGGGSRAIGGAGGGSQPLTEACLSLCNNQASLQRMHLLDMGCGSLSTVQIHRREMKTASHSNTAAPTRTEYRPEIDGLRAVAVLPVVLYHAGFNLFSGGYIGVDIFFVISGYLITTIVDSEIQRGSFSIVRFYERRVRRILPALFVVSLACIPFAWLWMLPTELKDSPRASLLSTYSRQICFFYGKAAISRRLPN